MYVITIFTLCTACYVQAKVTITKLEPCDKKADYPIKFTTSLKTENDRQVIEEGSLVNRIDLGDNILNVVDAYSLENGEYTFVITIKDTYCQSVKKYMGDFGYGMQKAAGIEPGACPIPKGEYKISNYKLDFSNFKYQNIPKGSMRLKNYLLNVKTNETVGCLDIDFTLE